MHLYDEIDFLEEMKDIYKNYKLYKLEKLIKEVINQCNTNKEKKECYEFIIDNKTKYINKNEFWEKWNTNLENILYE